MIVGNIHIHSAHGRSFRFNKHIAQVNYHDIYFRMFASLSLSLALSIWLIWTDLDGLYDIVSIVHWMWMHFVKCQTSFVFIIFFLILNFKNKFTVVPELFLFFGESKIKTTGFAQSNRIISISINYLFPLEWNPYNGMQLMQLGVKRMILNIIKKLCKQQTQSTSTFIKEKTERKSNQWVIAFLRECQTTGDPFVCASESALAYAQLTSHIETA